METSKILAIISIIIGLIFIIFPIFSANLISILIGAAVLIFGIGLAYTGIISKDISPAISTVCYDHFRIGIHLWNQCNFIPSWIAVLYCWIHANHSFRNRIAWRG